MVCRVDHPKGAHIRRAIDFVFFITSHDSGMMRLTPDSHRRTCGALLR